MAVIHHNIDLDVNSNCYKDTSKDDYGWGRSDFEYEGEPESADMASTIREVAVCLEGSLRSAKKAHLSCGEVLLPPDLLTHVARDIIHMADTEPCGLRGCLIILNFETPTPLPPSSPGSSPSTSPAPSPPPTPTATTPPSTITFNYTYGSAPWTLGSAAKNLTFNANAPSALPTNTTNRREIGKIRWNGETVTTFELHLTLKEDLAPWYSRLPKILRNLTKGGTIVVSPAYTIAKKKLYRSY